MSEQTRLRSKELGDSFSVYTLQSMNEGRMYSHWAEGLEMYIQKDGVSIKLSSEEIQQLVKALPRTIGGGY